MTCGCSTAMMVVWAFIARRRGPNALRSVPRGCPWREVGAEFRSAPPPKTRDDSCSGPGDNAAGKLAGWDAETSRTAASKVS